MPAHRPEPAAETDQRTRERVRRAILDSGPVSAAELAGGLQLTPAGVRRHLDVLLEQGQVAVWQGADRDSRGRGRPARRFVLTEAGHAAMSSRYDSLAGAALRFLADSGGRELVLRFAEQLAGDLERRYRPVVETAGPDPTARAQALAAALARDGYAAHLRPVPGPGAGAGVQLCQGHCPVQHVAREFPELCTTELAGFSRLLGVHVQRLATLANGEHVCTTHVPVAGGATPPLRVARPSPAVQMSSQERVSR